MCLSKNPIYAKIIGQIAVPTIVTALAAIAGVAMMVMAGDKAKIV